MKKVKQEIIKNAEIGLVKPKINGGQTCGMPRSKVYLKSEEVDFYIEIGYARSQLKNKEIALTLFELYLDEIIK